jgi:hypothetical protein
MLSIHQCRKFLGDGCVLSDSEVEALRDQFYCLAEVAVTIRPDQVRARRTPETWSRVSTEGIYQ